MSESLNIPDMQAARPVDPSPPALALLRSPALIQGVVLGALLLLVYWNPIQVAAETWTDDPDWSHGWLVPLFSLYLIYSRRDRLAAVPREPSFLGLVILLVALAAYFYFLSIRPYGYPRPLSLVMAIFGVVLFLGGVQVIRIAWLPILFLALAVPIPDSIYVELTMPLRRLTTWASAILLELIPGVDLALQGVIIDYEYGQRSGSLNVEEACAGMRLMMAFVTLGVAAAYLGDRPTWQRLIMVASCVPIAVLCNVIRVTITGMFTIFGYTNLAQGTTHELLGLAMLPIALGLFAATSWVLKHLFIEEPAAA